jgi:hypothetical protein
MPKEYKAQISTYRHPFNYMTPSLKKRKEVKMRVKSLVRSHLPMLFSRKKKENSPFNPLLPIFIR